MPAISLVLHPHRPVLRVRTRFIHRLWRMELLFGIDALMTGGGDEIRMHGLMREVQEVRLFLRDAPQPVERVIGQLVGDVPLLSDMLAVDIQSVLLGKVRALPTEAHPFIESRLRVVAGVPHVPLPDERRLAARALEQLWKEAGSAWNCRIVIDDVMPVSVEAGQNARATRRAKRGADERVLQMRAVARQGIEMRCA